MNEKKHLYQQTLQELETAQSELEAVTNINDDDDDDEDNLVFPENDSEKIALAEKKLTDVKEILELHKADLDEEEALLNDMLRVQKSSRSSCSKDVAQKFVKIFPIER